MKKIEKQIYERIKNRQLPNLSLTDLDKNISVITQIGFDRFMQFVTKIDEQEPDRIVTIYDIFTAFTIEQNIRAFLTTEISDAELLLRSVIGEYYLLWYGAHGYKKSDLFPDAETHDYLMYKVKKQLKMQPQYEVTALNLTDDIYELPIWAAMEIATFQMLTIFFKILPVDQQNEIATQFGLDATTFFSWLEFILVVRNACAHQGLLFGRHFNRKTILPKPYSRSVYAANYVLAHLLSTNFAEQEENISQFFSDSEDKWMMKYYGINE